MAGVLLLAGSASAAVPSWMHGHGGLGVGWCSALDEPEHRPRQRIADQAEPLAEIQKEAAEGELHEDGHTQEKPDAQLCTLHHGRVEIAAAERPCIGPCRTREHDHDCRGHDADYGCHGIENRHANPR